MKTNFLYLQFLVITLVLLLSSCSSKQPLPTTEERQEARTKVPCIIVLPVQTKVNTDSAMTYKSAAVLEEGAQFMDSVLADELVGNNNVRLLSNRQLTSLTSSDSISQQTLTRTIGSELKCGAVLTTTLIEYRQRVGGSYGADHPAAAAFSMKLINTRDGRVIWHTMFEETQQSLMSNLMSFSKAESRGFKWITVEELVRQATHEKIKECPYL